MANPFYIEPANPLQALMMGVQGYDRARKSAQQQAMQAARQEAGNLYAQGGDTRGALGRLIGLGDSDTVKAIASMQPKPNAEIEKLRILQNDPALMQTAAQLKRAGANQNTINMPPMEKAYDAAVGKEFAEQNIGIIKGSQDAQRKIGTLDRLGQLLADPKVQTGAGAEAILQAKRYAKTLGVDVGDIGGAEAVKAIGNQFALELRNPAGGAGMPGAMSDKDREFLQASVPGLQQTPEGNAKIIDYMKRVANRAVQVDKLRQDYVRKHGRLNEGFYQKLRQHSEANPLFPESGGSGPAQRRLRFNPQTGELE